MTAIKGIIEKSVVEIILIWFWIADRFGLSENNVSVILNRVRKKLKSYLIEKGYDI